MSRRFSWYSRIMTIAAALLLFAMNRALGQDIIVKNDGNEIKAKVEEVSDTEIKYRKSDNLSGPVYTMKKTEIFMVKYENGSKDVFGNQQAQTTPSAENAGATVSQGIPATIYFYRPPKFLGAANEIIVGTVMPDAVIVDLKNGRWFKTDYNYFGQRELVNGIFSINEKHLNVNFEQGKTYYIRCTIMQGMGMQSQIELVDEATAKKEMASLKEQEKSLDKVK
jgi:hypothetical protein